MRTGEPGWSGTDNGHSFTGLSRAQPRSPEFRPACWKPCISKILRLIRTHVCRPRRCVSGFAGIA